MHDKLRDTTLETHLQSSILAILIHGTKYFQGRNVAL